MQDMNLSTEDVCSFWTQFLWRLDCSLQILFWRAEKKKYSMRQMLNWHVWCKTPPNSGIHVILGLADYHLWVKKSSKKKSAVSSQKWQTNKHFWFFSTCQKTLYISVSIFHIQGGINVKSARFREATKKWISCEVAVGKIRFRLPLLSFHRPYLGKTWSQPLWEWKQISALSLHRPRSRKIQYLAYLRDQNLALWGRWRGRGTRRGRGRGAAACWPIDTPAPGCGMGCHARSGLWTAEIQRAGGGFWE